MRLSLIIISIILWWMPSSVLCQGWGVLEGKIADSTSTEPLVGVTILIQDTNFGTISNSEGYFSLRIPAQRTYLVKFSYIGYNTFTDSLRVPRDKTTTYNVRLIPSVTDIETLTVESTVPQDAGIHTLTPEDLINIPGPFKDGFRALKVLPGVSSNNELSNEYSVRGGGYNENLVFINGFEVFKPFRTRQGEQEGLGILNPELTESLTFYTGGFPAQFGGKLSSVLDVNYKDSFNQPITGVAYLSQLDGGLALSGANQQLSWNLAGRKAQARSFFSTQELKGQYDPNYTDIQGSLKVALSSNHTLEGLGIWADHTFNLEPSERKTYFGTFQDLRSIWFNYSGAEEDGYTIKFGGIRSMLQLSKNVSTQTQFAYFDIDEREQYNVRGTATLYLVDPQETNPDTPTEDIPIGSVIQQDIADNQVKISTHSFENHWKVLLARHIVKAGISWKKYKWFDRLFEESSVRGQNASGEPVNVVVEKLDNTLPEIYTTQLGFFVQDVLDVLPERNRFILTGGLRADYFYFNREWTFSPRLTALYKYSEQLVLSSSLGIYYQQPTYRELRGEPTPFETISEALNHQIKSQKSFQVIVGGEYFLPKTRFYLRAEAYYKNLRNLISYDVHNTRLTYSGENDSEGYTYGLDLQLKGEFVPGLESWFNYGFMVSKEKFYPEFQTSYNDGWRARAMDQRHTFSLYVQDELPTDPSWRTHMRLLFGSGFPYTPPVPGERINNITLQEPGQRHSQRYIEYKRVDLGVTKTFQVSKKTLTPLSQQPKLFISAELLNIFDVVNTISYAWVAGTDGLWQRIPTRLTPRTINARIRFQF